MTTNVKFRLSLMMFLQFFIWGAWFVTMGTFLAKNLSVEGAQIGQAYETQAIGAIIAPFIIGLIADRFFPAQIILGVLHLFGAGLMYVAAQSSDFGSFYPYIFIYMILYMPTLALVNSVFIPANERPYHAVCPSTFMGYGWVDSGGYAHRLCPALGKIGRTG